MVKTEECIVRLFDELSKKGIEIHLTAEGWMAYDILLGQENSEQRQEKVG